MAHPSDPSFLVLHGLRLKGFADDGAMSATTGLPVEELGGLLSDLARDELVLHRDGRVTGWALTPAGRARHADMLEEEMEQSSARDKVETAYRRFLEINRDLLTICTDWQLRQAGSVSLPNDHSDAAYDSSVIGRLAEVDASVGPICEDLASVLERYGRYRDRLYTALDKVRSGAHEWFTRPMIDSYHTVWFEFHEDLLVTLAIERHREGEA